MLRNQLFVILLFLSISALAQDAKYYFGQLVDVTKNEPVSFATIRLKDKALGLITNIDGTFKIPFKFKTLGEVIEISSMGYESLEISIQDLVIDQSNIIKIKPSTFELTEAVVSAKIKRLSPKQIVKIAVKSIPQNYPQKNFGMVGYYRDYQINNAEYNNLNEAILKVFDIGFSKKDNFQNQYQLLDYKKNFEFKIDSFAKQPYDYIMNQKVIPGAKMENIGGNEVVTLMIHDAIRNYQIKTYSFIDDISVDFLQSHRFRLKQKTNYKDETVFEIECLFRNSDYFAEGIIFINTDNFAILKLDYAVYKREKPGSFDVAINAEEKYSDGFNKTKKELIYHVITEYAKVDKGNYFLNYISFYNKMLIQRPPEFFSKFVVDLRDNSFNIRLNKVPANLDRIKKGDFIIKYKEELLPIKEFFFSEDERRFTVCPPIKYTKAADALEPIFTENDKAEIADLTYSYGEIKDSLGNQLDERKWEYLHQYREFFVQETMPFSTIGNISKDSLMQKMKPLDNETQHISTKSLKNDYWMNTPLPKFKN